MQRVVMESEAVTDLCEAEAISASQSDVREALLSELTGPAQFNTREGLLGPLHDARD